MSQEKLVALLDMLRDQAEYHKGSRDQHQTAFGYGMEKVLDAIQLELAQEQKILKDGKI